MFKVGVLGHSLLNPYIPGGNLYEESQDNINLKFFCQGGATFSSIINSSAYSDLLVFSPDLVVLVLGGNDLVNGCRIADVYSDLVDLVNTIDSYCSPQFGVHILEPEHRVGDPRFVGQSDYLSLRNSLSRKIKFKNFPNFLPLIKYGVNRNLLSDDGVHLDDCGQDLLLTVLKNHIFSLLPNEDQYYGSQSE